MIRPILLSENNIKFAENPDKKIGENPKAKESSILPNTLKTRVLQKYQKTTNAVLEYPIKGLKGDVNSDFYEFLSMGIIPYLIGSAMFMGLFNLLKNLNPKSQKFASTYGNKMVMGVLMYGIFKTLSADLITRPISYATGVDIELPVEHVYYPLPKEPGESAKIIPQIQQRKVYDSREFFRTDLIQKDPKYGIKYYDKIAKKNKLGENLNDSVTEATPIIQSVVSTAKTAKSLSTYCWAALGIGIAAQDSWNDFFGAIRNRRRHVSKPNEKFTEKMSKRFSNAGKNFVDISKTCGKSFTKACKTLWTGENNTSGFMKHAGKGWILFTGAMTVGTVANSIWRARQISKLSNKNVINKDKESVVI